MPVIKPATNAPEAPQQHKQPSRKGKKAWRKNVDVTEIQDGLEEVRDEIIKGYVLYMLELSLYLLIIVIVASLLKKIRLTFSPSIRLETHRYKGKS